MDLKQLKYFARIVELESITAAAQSMFVAQPSLSQHVANLEAELGARLLERGPHGARPTRAGELLYNYAIAILRQVQDATIAIKQEATPVGRVSLGLPTSMSRMLSVELIDTLIERCPQVSVEIVEGGTSQLADMIARQRLDMAVAADVQPGAKYDVRPLLVEQLLLVARADEPLQGPVSLEDVCRHPLILPSFPNSVRVKMETACNARDLQYRVVAESSAAQVMAATARRGLALTILPWCALGDEDARMQHVEIDDPHFYRTLFLCTSKLGTSNSVCDEVSGVLIDLMLTKVRDDSWRYVRPLTA
jgi:LysR family nitrogen assimilation transcriptional regulator